MSEEEKEKEGTFKVTDRRMFTEDGEVREKTAASPPEDRPQQSTPPKTASREAPRRPPAGESGRKPPPIDFSSFLLSLATTAMVHLGEMVDPDGGRSPENIDAAKQMVDILAMLQKKTEGNRTSDETRLLDDILYELRMKILAKTQAIKL